MAENKKSVLLYCDIIHTVEELSNEEAGKLFKHYLRYINDLNPPEPDKLTKIVFEPIKQTLKRDLKKWEDKSIKNQAIAIEGWKKRKDANASERKKQDAKDADIDTVTVKVNVNDSVKDKEIKKEMKDVALPLSDYQVCLDFWLKEFHPDFTFGGQQGKALKSILKKIERLRKNRDVPIVDSFKLICQKLPEWYKTKDLPVIDSKLNEIISELKKQENGTVAKSVARY